MYKKVIIEIIERPKEERTKAELNVLHNFIVGKFNFFDKLTEDDENDDKVKAVVSNLKIMKVPRNFKIIKFGEQGKRCYFIHKGKFKVTKPIFYDKEMNYFEILKVADKIKNEEQDEFKYKRLWLNNPDFDFDELLLDKGDQFKGRRMFKVEGETFLSEKVEGEIFGEIALQQDIRRTASVVSTLPSIVFFLEKTDYQKTIKAINEKRIRQQIEEIKTKHAIFRSWGFNDLHRLLFSLKKVKVNKGFILTRQNDLDDRIFLTDSGNFEIELTTDIVKKDTFLKYLNDDSYNILDFASKNIYIEENSLINKISEFSNLIEKAYSSKEKANQIDRFESTRVGGYKELYECQKKEQELKSTCLKTIKVRTVSGCDVLGIEEAFGLKRRYCSIRVTSQTATFYSCTLLDMIKLISCRLFGYKSIDRLIKQRTKLLENFINQANRIYLKHVEDHVRMEYKFFLTKHKELNEVDEEEINLLFGANDIVKEELPHSKSATCFKIKKSKQISINLPTPKREILSHEEDKLEEKEGGEKVPKRKFLNVVKKTETKYEITRKVQKLVKEHEKAFEFNFHKDLIVVQSNSQKRKPIPQDKAFLHSISSAFRSMNVDSTERVTNNDCGNSRTKSLINFLDYATGFRTPAKRPIKRIEESTLKNFTTLRKRQRIRMLI